MQIACSDGPPSAAPNTPEVREHAVIGAVKGGAIGEMSEIREVVCAG